jgi:hypothetical protein
VKCDHHSQYVPFAPDNKQADRYDQKAMGIIFGIVLSEDEILPDWEEGDDKAQHQ